MPQTKKKKSKLRKVTKYYLIEEFINIQIYDQSFGSQLPIILSFPYLNRML